ncbi:two-component system, OmpR family, phosphate regulon response regulator OmpR [Solimonas aquatica]|uniref:Two-component system, OmpR family, phosphate regulon response regulator OmpR n=1 Tax=Solimonas aquatica TaxID=489703 RepID=A0A1H9L8W1_9GAMM|nr:response regulator [Solimonas aquatica]SER07844.1 two-component system, OmpR family, phosphate regulon response regulator OmpR [Solimonas aquatica]
MKAKVLLVDDDERLRQMTAEYLLQHGIESEGAGTAAGALRLLGRQHFDLVVLDLMLPDGDGIDLCRRLRGGSMPLPIIIVSAKGDDVDRIIGLEVGADDYLAKPCNLRELVARIFTVLRRFGQTPGAAGSGAVQRHRIGEFELDLWSRSLLRGGELVRITTREFQLLEALVLHARRVLSRDELMTLISGRPSEALSRSIDIQISRLRQLLEADPASPRYIQTVWGRGYMFVPDAPET